jgi:hypothetical protein
MTVNQLPGSDRLTLNALSLSNNQLTKKPQFLMLLKAGIYKSGENKYGWDTFEERGEYSYIEWINII